MKNLNKRQYKVIFFKKFFLFIFSFFCISVVYSEIEFSDFTINNQNDLLFSVRAEDCDGRFYTTLFLKHYKSDKFEQLTFYPENLKASSDFRFLQVSNKTGTVTLDLNSNEFSMKVFSFLENSEVLENGSSFQLSPSGRYLVVVEPKDFVFGKLVLYDLDTSKKFFVFDNVLNTFAPIKWSSDESAFLFESQGSIYFTRPTWLLENTKSDDIIKKHTASKIAETSMDVVNWLSNNTFCFIENSKFYTVQATNVLAFSIYDSISNIKKLKMDLPFLFSQNTDRIYLSKSFNSILLAKENSNLYFWSVNNKTNIPYLKLPENCFDLSVVWNNEQPFISFKTQNGIKCFWYAEKDRFVELKTDGNIFSISPNGSFILVQDFKKTKNFTLKDLNSNQNIFTFQNVISVCWIKNSSLIVGTEFELLKIDLTKKIQHRLFLSEVEDFSWGKNDTDILAKQKNQKNILQNVKALSWKLSNETKLFSKKTYNKKYRLYIDKGFANFSTMIFFRSVNFFETTPLIKNYNKLKSKKNIIQKNASIIFDIMENTQGLETVLHTLKKHNSPATFFLTAEVINSYPESVRKIVKASYPCGSLFFNAINLSDSRYTITKDFIKNGLKYVEDSFYKMTGSELSVFWHTPFYVTSDKIISFAKESGYHFVLPTILISDWILPDSAKALPNIPKNSYEIINYILENANDNAIIPIQIGSIPGRNDYLYDKLDLLLDFLKKNGFKIVSLQDLKN